VTVAAKLGVTVPCLPPTGVVPRHSEVSTWHEGVLNTLQGSFQGLTLPGGGVFALRMDTFAQYYAGFGGA
jgi:hypothetical protein